MLYENYKAGSLWFELYERQTMDERKVAYYERLLTSKISLIELIIYQATDYIKSLWEKQSNKMLKEKDATLKKVEKALLKKSLFAALWYIGCTGILIHSVMTGHISVGLFIALFNTTLSIVDTITNLLETFGDFSKEIKEVSYISSFFELKIIGTKEWDILKFRFILFGLKMSAFPIQIQRKKFCMMRILKLICRKVPQS